MSPDLRLLHLAAAGDDLAFERWLAVLRPALVRFAAERLGDQRAEAEDVVQDSSMRALLALRGGKVPEAPRAWMYAIVRNRCHDVRTGSARLRADPLADELLSGLPGPDERAHARRRLEVVVDAIAGLPDSQRAALVSATFEGRPYAEIAERQGTTVPAVKSLLHRARAGLQDARARAAAVAPGLLAARERVPGLGALLGAGGGEGPLGATALHAVAAVAVAAAALASAPAVEHHVVRPAVGALHAAPRAVRASADPVSARIPVRAEAAVPAAATVRSADPIAALDACDEAAPLAGRFTPAALAGARRRLDPQQAEYSACSDRLSGAALGQG